MLMSWSDVYNTAVILAALSMCEVGTLVLPLGALLALRSRCCTPYGCYMIHL